MRPATRAASGSRALVLTRGGSVPKHRGGRTVTRSSVLLAAAAIRRAHAAAAFGRRASPSRLAAAGKGDGDAPGGQVDEVEEDIPFGYTRKDVILVGVGLTVFGYVFYYGLQSFGGLNPIVAGNVVQVVFAFLLSIGWLSTYLFRVATKNMTYTQQLKDYESAVMEKRLEELSEDEVDSLIKYAEKLPEPKLLTKKTNTEAGD